MADKRIAEVKKLLEYQKTVRGKSDQKRWAAFSMVQHRLPSQTCADDCPVEERSHIYSSTGVDAFESFIAGFMGAFMSPNQDWFSLRLISKKNLSLAEPDYGIDFTDYVKRATKYELDHSNFYSENEMASKDSFCGGYSCTLIQNNPKKNMCYYQTLLPWRCFFDMDLQGNWNQFFYIYKLTGLQVLDRFPDLDQESKLYKSAKKSGVDGVFEFVFAIIERQTADNAKFSVKFVDEMQYASLDICLTTNEIVAESGYADFPVVIHIWSKSGDSHYGEGGVMKYLSELRKLDRLGYEYGLVVAKINHHAWLVPDSMYESFSSDPETRIKYQSLDLIPRPLDENLDIKSAMEALQDQETKIRHLFRNELFNFFLQTDKVYTATQVNQVKADALSVLAPVYGNIQNQKIDPQIILTISIMASNGRLELDSNYVGASSDYKFKIELDSAMSRQITSYSQINAAMASVEILQIMASIGVKTAMQNANTDNITRGYMMGSGAPANYFVPMTKIENDRKAEAEQMAKQLEIENRLKESEINRNNAGAANLNNIAGNNGGEQ